MEPVKLSCLGVSLCLLCTLAISVPAIIISSDDAGAACLGSYGGISFNYTKWLNIYGWINVACLGLFLILLSGYLVSGSATEAGFVLSAARVYAVIDAFHLAWFVVGAILFWKEVDGYCPADQPLHDFALALFILQCIFICCSCSVTKSSKGLSRDQSRV